MNTKFLSMLLSAVISLTSCTFITSSPAQTETIAQNEITATQTPIPITPPSEDNSLLSELTVADIPAYSGEAYITVNNNIPYFSDADLTTEAFEKYSELDSLGRCGITYANICKEIMPTEKRQGIGQVKPVGWHTKKYNVVGEGNDGYLYHRCHLIAYELAGENANTRNLITGTKYMNKQGMLPFENRTADYVKATNNHVLYRVTPIYDGNNLLCHGVQIEAKSVEDNGAGLCFNVFCYNVQPHIVIDYATGDNWLDEMSEPQTEAEPQTQSETTPQTDTQNASSTYILNTNTKKFHYPYCSSVEDISEKNKREFTGSREDVINQGYVACKRCNP